MVEEEVVDPQLAGKWLPRKARMTWLRIPSQRALCN